MLDQNVFQEILYNRFFCLNIFFTKKYIHQIFKKKWNQKVLHEILRNWLFWRKSLKKSTRFQKLLNQNMFKEILNKNGPSSKIMAQNQNLSNFLTFVKNFSGELNQSQKN